MVFDTVEKQDIRTLDIDKLVKGFALVEYVFKNLVTVSTRNGDSIRWYQETSADLTPTGASVIENVSPLSVFPTLEHSWQRNTSFPRKFAVEGFISMEDLATTDIDVQARTVLRLTRAIVKAVDTRIYDILTESQAPVNIGSAAAAGTGWADTSNGDPIGDILSGQQVIAEANYKPLGGGGMIMMDPRMHKELLQHLIIQKGSNIPSFAVEKVKSGVVMNLLGMGVVVNNNVKADSVSVSIPAQAVTWKTLMGTQSRIIEEPGIGIKIRVWEEGEAILTDPGASYLITDTIN